MKYFWLLFTALISACASTEPLPPSDAVRVRGYWRADGRYVNAYYRSRPDTFTSNNFGLAEFNRKK